MVGATLIGWASSLSILERQGKQAFLSLTPRKRPVRNEHGF
jgi:hypothetical protein